MEDTNLIQILIILCMLFNAMGKTISQTTPPPPPQTMQATSPPQTLNIVVPVTAYKEYVSLTYDSVTGEPQFDGFAIKVFNAAIQSVYIDNNNLPKIIFHSYAKLDGTLNGTFDSMLQAVSLQQYDGAVGDISIRFDRTQWVDFTRPFSETGISMMVSTNQQPKRSTRIKVLSLIKGIVYASFGLCLISAFIFWFVEFRNDKNRSTHASLGSNNPPAQRVNNDEYWRRETLRAITHTRLVIVLLFLVLTFLTSCYTASLTSLLTSSQRHQTPIRTLDELIRTKANVGILTGSYTHRILIEKGFSENQLYSYSSEQQMIDMLSKGSAPGGIVAVIEEIAYLKVFLSKNCNKGYTLVPSFNILSEGFGFAFQKGSQLVEGISNGILRIMDNGTLAEIQRMTIGDLEICQNDSNIAGVDSDTLDMDTVWVLFAGVMGVAILVIIVYLAYLGTTFDASKRRVAYPCYLLANCLERKS